MALLGILVMNIGSFATVFAAYMNPTVWGDHTGVNRLVHDAAYVFAHQKFVTLFSILFGAGVLLMTGRAKERTGKSAALHYRRMLWLILIGLLHAYAIWYGDILVLYGATGMAIYPLRRLRPRWLLTIGAAGIGIPLALTIGFGLSRPHWPRERARESLESWSPPAETIAEEIATYRGGWWEQMGNRVPTAVKIETFVFAFFGLWRIGGLMLVGMALLKLGVLSGERSRRVYLGLAACGVAGWALSAWGLRLNDAAGWSYAYSGTYGEIPNYFGSLLASLGYVGFTVLALRSPRLAGLLQPVSAVGQTAFSNYLLQSILCTTLFYGHGFGLFAQVERGGQMLIVLAVWAVELTVSPLWLRRFRFGPAEWLWRSLTYGRLQPMRRERRLSAPVPA